MKQDRFLLGILAGILILIVLALVLFFLRQGQAGYVAEEDTPGAVLNNYVTAIDRQDFQRAYSYLAESPNKPALSVFRSTILNGRAGSRPVGLEIGDAQIDVNEAIVRVTVVRVSGGPLADTYREPQTATLERQGGSWKITGMAYPYWDWSWSAQNTQPEKPRPASP